MNEEIESAKPSSGMGLGDIYFILFRQKWIILLSSTFGIAAALAVLLLKPKRYESDTKLYIRYVASGQSLRPPGSEGTTVTLNAQEQAIINTEVELLQSFDLARQVVELVGADKILGTTGGSNNVNAAAALVKKGIALELPIRGSVIPITFRHSDPEMAQVILNKIILAYFRKHADAHQSVGNMGEFLQKETARLRDEIVVTETELRDIKNKVGVISIEEAKTGYAEQLSRVREELFGAEADLAAQQAALGELPSNPPVVVEPTNNLAALPASVVNEYKALFGRLDFLSRREQELLMQYTKGSRLVREVHDQIAEIENTKKTLELQYPGLAELIITPVPVAGLPANGPTVGVQVRALKSKVAVLRAQMGQIQGEAAKLDEMEPRIMELTRKKERQEADLKYYATSLEQSKVDRAMGAEAAPNIGIIEPPTPPVKKWPKPFLKKVAGLAAAGIIGGLVLAFLIELLFDRSVKRGVDVENKLHLPLFMTIPDMNHPGQKSLIGAAADRSPLQLNPAPGESVAAGKLMEIAGGGGEHPIRRFYEGLRNRLIVHFEVWNLKHKPKLVAVTSCGRGSGVSSTAAGLAASLSETGDGSVLLVDMNCERGTAQHFLKGQAVSGLETALTSPVKSSDLIHTNLYAADDNPGRDLLPEALPRRFATLMPKFKASNYDFIIFDMPPVSQTSVTPRIAGFMDMVLLVIEAEKTNQDLVKRANALLAESNAKVRAVLNKTRNYVPARLQQELLDDQ